MKNDFTERLEKNDLINILNDDSADTVNVLIPSDIENPDEEHGRYEGCWVYRIKGDHNNGLGFLLSNIVGFECDISRGDIVQYQRKDGFGRPVVVQFVSGKGN